SKPRPLRDRHGRSEVRNISFSHKETADDEDNDYGDFKGSQSDMDRPAHFYFAVVNAREQENNARAHKMSGHEKSLACRVRPLCAQHGEIEAHVFRESHSCSGDWSREAGEERCPPAEEG